MVKQGRTINQAIADGNLYEISRKGWGQYCPPACETPDEVMAAAKTLFRDIAPGMVFEVTRIVGYVGNAKLVEDCGTITA